MSLSAVTGEDVRVTNIRKNRPKPGLKAQHIKAIETAALLCNADVTGLSIGSTDITFSPLELRGVTLNLRSISELREVSRFFSSVSCLLQPALLAILN